LIKIVCVAFNIKNKVMKKIIFAVLLALTVNVYAQNDLLEKFKLDNIFFETYVVGSNDTSSIGLLKDLFIDSTAKEKFREKNSKLDFLQVTGTASPFDKRIPFLEWINDYVKIEKYHSSQIKYTVSKRSDGMVQEFLVINNNEGWKRTVIISRMDGSIISIWDSNLN
jgi:hypothetical protein